MLITKAMLDTKIDEVERERERAIAHVNVLIGMRMAYQEMAKTVEAPEPEPPATPAEGPSHP